MKKCFVVLLTVVVTYCASSQNSSMSKVEYAIIAEGKDAIIPDLHITCFALISILIKIICHLIFDHGTI